MTWADHLTPDGQFPVWVVDEALEHRERDTFGGYCWDADVRKPITWADLLPEVVWLLDGGMHPLLVADTIDRDPKAIYMAAKRAGYERVRAAYVRYTGSVEAKAA